MNTSSKSKYVKYPRTYHLNFSLGVQSDDKIQHDLSSLIGQEVVVTLKMDGENTTLYNDHIHARSIDSAFHPSRAWVKNWWSCFSHDIQSNMRICGENMYAVHSIEYDSLESYFYGFNIWIDDTCLSWDETLEYFELFGISCVPVVYDGIFDIEVLKKLAADLDVTTTEGFVVRNKNSFSYSNFRDNVVKYVRANHVQSSQHWMNTAIVKNKLIE